MTLYLLLWPKWTGALFVILRSTGNQKKAFVLPSLLPSLGMTIPGKHATGNKVLNIQVGFNGSLTK